MTFKNSSGLMMALHIALAILVISYSRTIRPYLGNTHVIIVILFYLIGLAILMVQSLFEKNKIIDFIFSSLMVNTALMAIVTTGLYALELIMMSYEKITLLPKLPLYLSTYQPILIQFIVVMLYIIFYMFLPSAMFWVSINVLQDEYRKILYGKSVQSRM